MAWAERLANGHYRAVWRDADGRQRSKSWFTEKDDAERYGATQEFGERQGKTGYRGRSITWGEWCDQWQRYRTLEASSADAEAWRITKWLRPQWGGVQLVKIKRGDVQAWVTRLAADMSPASVAKVYRILSTSMKAAVEHDVIAISPCVGIKLPKTPPGHEVYLSRGEVDTIAHYMREPYRSAVILLVGTGLRFGEMAGLHWHRLDLNAQAIDVVETWDDTAGRVKGYPKSGRTRRVPVPDWVLDAIGLPGEAKTCGLIHAGGSRCRSGLVIPAPEGGALSARNMRNRHFGPALRHAGIEHVRIHDLRHTYASWLLQGGASLSEVAQVMGHSSITVTTRYAHLAPSHAERVRSILDATG